MALHSPECRGVLVFLQPEQSGNQTPAQVDNRRVAGHPALDFPQFFTRLREVAVGQGGFGGMQVYRIRGIQRLRFFRLQE